MDADNGRMMDEPANCHVLIEPTAGDGAWNMAVDETLLETAIQRNECWLRLYRWKMPTVSLGYFQSGEPGEIPRELAILPVVRRLSGGGAILHDRELTYSCAVPVGHRFARAPVDLYHAVHNAIIAVLDANGVHARTRGATRRLPNEPFLCFARQDANDIVLNGYKILGSAQRRRRGAVLQHGSLVLAHSDFTPDSPGIHDLMPDCRLADDLAGQIGRVVADTLAPRSRSAALSDMMRQRAIELMETRYAGGLVKKPKTGKFT